MYKRGFLCVISHTTKKPRRYKSRPQFATVNNSFKQLIKQIECSCCSSKCILLEGTIGRSSWHCNIENKDRDKRTDSLLRSVYLSLSPSVLLSVLSVCLSVSVSLCMSLSLSACLSVCLLHPK